jgi:hypothetical protein
MLRCLLGSAAAALVLAPPAFADGGTAGVTQGWDGVAAANGQVRYVTIPGAEDTALAVIRTRGGRVQRFISIPGLWGIPSVTFNGTGGGLSADGRTLILGEAIPQTTPLRKESGFLLVDTKSLQTTGFVRLNGDFAYDALSPDTRMLYLIQHVSAGDLSRYVVRAYDLQSSRLLPARIADRTQRAWVMQGYGVARVTSSDSRMVYTLYSNAEGYPFIHALDSVKATAHCIGIPWHGDQNGVWQLRLALRDGGRQLAVAQRNGATFVSVNTQTYRLSHPATARAGFPWWAVAVGGGIALGGLVVTRRRRTEPAA